MQHPIYHGISFHAATTTIYNIQYEYCLHAFVHTCILACMYADSQKHLDINKRLDIHIHIHITHIDMQSHMGVQNFNHLDLRLELGDNRKALQLNENKK